MGRQGTSHRVMHALSSSIPVAGVFAWLIVPSLPVNLSIWCRGLEQVGRLYHKAVLTVFPLQPHSLALGRGVRRRQRLLICLWILQQPVEAVATPLEPEKGRAQQEHWLRAQLAANKMPFRAAGGVVLPATTFSAGVRLCCFVRQGRAPPKPSKRATNYVTSSSSRVKTMLGDAARIAACGCQVTDDATCLASEKLSPKAII